MVKADKNLKDIPVYLLTAIPSSEVEKNLKETCKKHNVPFEEKLIDGKNSDTIIDQSQSYDLVVMGAQGIGTVSGFQT
jgi:nucleotide-binding universal stress UspA family protein